MAEIKTYRYSDISLFPAYNQNSLVFDIDSINQNILMIIMTPIGAGWFDPSIGCLIVEYLFDPVDDLGADRIKDEILSVLPRNFETRVVITGCVVVPMPEENLYYVSIQYDVPTLSQKKVVFNFNIGNS